MSEIPPILILTLPIPFLILTILLTLYHLTPLLSLLPNIHLLPLLNNLSTLIPRPKRNLPREFFNLPPRPDTPLDNLHLHVLTIRGKIILCLCLHSIVGIAFGWVYLSKNFEWSLGLGVLGLPGFIATCALFVIVRSGSSSWQRILKRGGITHSTIFSRILPISLIPCLFATVIGAAVPRIAAKVVLGVLSLVVSFTIVCSIITGYRIYFDQSNRIRLPTDTELANDNEVIEESWLSEFSQPSSPHISSFAFSPTPSTRTPNHRNRRPSNANDDSWLSSPTNTPSTLPPWDLTRQTITSPQTALTRERSHSPISQSLPRPIQPTTTPRRGKFFQATTAGDRTMTTLTSPGGSILGGYEPDPANPLPTGFTSLSSLPRGSGQLEHFNASRVSLATRAGRSVEAIGYIPEEQDSQDPRASTWTLDTYHSNSDRPFTPARTSTATPATGRRAPPPPPMPVHMPLPPTPTAARSETAVEWGPHPKESREFLIGEREWVEVDPDVDALDGWSRDGRGIGPLAIFALLLIYALATPLLASERNGTTEIMYLISLLVSPPLLAWSSYLLRYRPTMTTRQRVKKSSIKSSSTVQSLALTAPSQLSLPTSLSPKLTPPNEKRIKRPNATWRHFLNPKPSVSNFGFNRPKGAKPEVDGVRDQLAEEQYRKNANRRSGDVWIEMGHAIKGGNRLSRTAEMLKPNPAMRVLDKPERSKDKPQGGMASLLIHRLSGLSNSRTVDTRKEDLPASPVAINITSPSKYDNRTSTFSEAETHEGEEGMTTLPSAEIQIATKGRMSSSPIFFCGRPGSAAIARDGYDVDWMTAGVLPNLVSHLRIGSDVRVGPGPSEIASRRASQPLPAIEHDISVGSIRNFRGSLDMGTPSRHGHSRAHSSSVDFSFSPNFDHAMASTPHGNIRHRLRHKKSFSLPTINPADFTDVRKSFDDCGKTPPRNFAPGQDSDDMGLDLPPVPSSYIRDLSRVSEREEGNESSLMRDTMIEMAPAILALSSPRPVTNSNEESSRMDLADLAPIIFGSNLSASFSSLIRTEEELMAEEMERVLEMDTPTRTEFVISPLPSGATSLDGRDSRASLRTTRSTTSLQVPPLPVPSRYSTGWTTATSETSTGDTTLDQFTDAEESLPSAPTDFSLDLPEIRHHLAHTVSMPTMSHPHPPPAILGGFSGIPNLSRPDMIPSVHPPISRSNLRRRKSVETIHSDYTTSTNDKTPPRAEERFIISEKELKRLSILKERREISRGINGSRSHSALGHYAQPNAQGVEKRRNGLKPLELVERKQNRVSMPIPQSTKRISIFKDGPRVNGPKDALTLSTVSGKENGGKVSTTSKASVPSGKEDRSNKGSKASSGVGRPLRA